ncbi:hypothetical protein, partial [Klebsiella pneumoniae]|uniref:hypothetical protein n=1 Tax=Klebsiella pneumoniae TaxID=573 RepID=UPI00276FB940|nr:hypothetical protein [Klebsiella pneumoniae]
TRPITIRPTISTSGLEEVSEGTIELDGRDITEVTPAKRDLALIHFCAVFALLLSAIAVAAVDQPRREIRFAIAAQLPPFQSRTP